jgi:hypothetical protein
MRADLGFGLVDRTGFEPVSSSVSGNSIYLPCFRIMFLNCDVSSANVHGPLPPSRVVVTQLVTRLGLDALARTLGSEGATHFTLRCTAQTVVLGGLASRLANAVFLAAVVTDRRDTGPNRVSTRAVISRSTRSRKDSITASLYSGPSSSCAADLLWRKRRSANG